MFESDRKNVRLLMYAIVYASVVAGFYVISSFNYLFFHGIIEIITVAIGLGIFMIAWNSRRLISDSFFSILGIAFLFSAILDLMHVFAYKGMGVLNFSDSDSATQLWLVARYLQVIAFIIAPAYIAKKSRLLVFTHAYLAIGVFSVIAIFYWDIFPSAYIEGKGLTNFKIFSEYLISAGFLYAIYLLRKNKSKFDNKVYGLLLWSMSAAALAEISFTSYASVYGFANFAGHLFKLVEYYLFYRAIIVIGVSKPYDLLFLNLIRSQEALKKEKERAQQYLNLANVIFVVINSDQTVHLINKKGTEVIGLPEEEIVGKNWFDHFSPAQIRDSLKIIFNKIISGEMASFEYYENPIITASGEERIIAWRNTSFLDDGKIMTLSAGEDITEYKKFQNQMNELSEKVNGQRHLPIGSVVEDTLRDVN